MGWVASVTSPPVTLIPLRVAYWYFPRAAQIGAQLRAVPAGTPGEAPNTPSPPPPALPPLPIPQYPTVPIIQYPASIHPKYPIPYPPINNYSIPPYTPKPIPPESSAVRNTWWRPPPLDDILLYHLFVPCIPSLSWRLANLCILCYSPNSACAGGVLTCPLKESALCARVALRQPPRYLSLATQLSPGR